MAVAVGALTVGLGACGDTTTPTATVAKAPTSVAALKGMTPAEVLARVSGGRETSRTARFAMTSTLQGKPSISATGAYQRGTKTVMKTIIDLTTVDPAAGAPRWRNLEGRFIDGAFYIRPVGDNSPFGRRWEKRSSDDPESASGLNIGDMSDLLSHIDPQTDVDLLLQAGDLADLGEELVDGVPTRHYRGTVKEATMVQTIGASAATRFKLHGHLRMMGVTATVEDVWVDGEFHVRRSVSRWLSKHGDSTRTLAFSGFGEPVTVTAPDNSDVVDYADLPEVRCPFATGC
jgi:hypothetical protein